MYLSHYKVILATDKVITVTLKDVLTATKVILATNNLN